MTSLEEYYAAKLRDQQAASLHEYNERVDAVNKGLPLVPDRLCQDPEYLMKNNGGNGPSWFLCDGKTLVGWEPKYYEYTDVYTLECYFLSDGTLVTSVGGYTSPEYPAIAVNMIKFTRIDSLDQRDERLDGIYKWLSYIGIWNFLPKPPVERKPKRGWRR